MTATRTRKAHLPARDANDRPNPPRSTSARPGPGARVTRTAGQAGGVLTLVQLWQAFGWAGAGGWTAEEATLRWPAVTAALVLVVAAVQNAYGAWRER